MNKYLIRAAGFSLTGMLGLSLSGFIGGEFVVLGGLVFAIVCMAGVVVNLVKHEEKK